MGRVLLIIGAVVGGLVLAFGTLGLILAYAQPDANQSDEIVGSIFFMVVGAIVAAPCTFFAYRLGRRSGQPWSPSGSPALATPGADVQQSYLAWFAWCQQALGGDAVSLHAATMAAIGCGGGWESDRGGFRRGGAPGEPPRRLGCDAGCAERRQGQEAVPDRRLDGGTVAATRKGPSLPIGHEPAKIGPTLDLRSWRHRQRHRCAPNDRGIRDYHRPKDHRREPRCVWWASSDRSGRTPLDGVGDVQEASVWQPQVLIQRCDW